VHFTPEILAEKTNSSYKNLLDIVEEARSNDIILTKEMAAWVGLHTKEYENFFDLCQKPIIFLIRNPYLSTISRLKKLIATLDMRYKESITTTIISLLGLKYNKLEFSLNYQQELLDRYAKSENFPSWKELVKFTQDSEDFSHVSEILANLDIYNNAFSGFSAINEQINYLTKNDIPYKIVDSTIFRLLPEDVLKTLCDYLEIDFDKKMVVWNDDIFKIPLGNQQKDYQKLWYTRAQNSRNIEPPKEFVKDTMSLPKHINKYLEKTDLPIYKELLNDKNLIKPDSLLTTLENVVTEGKGMDQIDPTFTKTIKQIG
jgi:hypothetical protein